MKSFLCKVYASDNTTLLKTYGTEIVSVPSFSSQINGGYGSMSVELNLPFDDFDEGGTVDFENIVKVYAIDENNPNGRLIFSGVLSQYIPYTSKSSQGVKLELLGGVIFLTRDYFKNGSSFTVTKTSMDVSDILEDIIDHFASIYTNGVVAYNGGSIDSVGTNVSYDFVDLLWYDAIKKAFELVGGGWYWKIDADGIFYLKQKPSSATHTFTFGKDIDAFEARKTTEKIINVATVRYTGGDYTASDSASITDNGRRAILIDDTQITDSTTAQKKAESYVTDNKEPKVLVRLRINSAYDIESVKVGESCKIRNFNSEGLSLSDNMLITHISYTPDYIDLQLEDFTSFGKELLSSITT